MQIAEVGIGIYVEGNPPEPEAIRSAVKTILDDHAYRQRAQALQHEMKNLPDLSVAVQHLEDLARTKQPQINERF
jgi:UDP:flavonoid glycosyltransferase YjiC (YdhE family)